MITASSKSGYRTLGWKKYEGASLSYADVKGAEDKLTKGAAANRRKSKANREE